MTLDMSLEGILWGTELGDGCFREKKADMEGEFSEWMLSGEGQWEVVIGKKLRLTVKGLVYLARGFGLYWWAESL